MSGAATTEVRKMLKAGKRGKLGEALAAFKGDGKPSLLSKKSDGKGEAVSAEEETATGMGDGKILKIPLSVKSETATVDLDLIDPFVGQPRDYFNDIDQDNLGVSIKYTGQLERMKVIKKPDGRFMLIDGERRLRSLRAKGAKKGDVDIRTFARPLTKDELFLLSGAYNSNRIKHTTYENYRLIRRIMDMPMCKGQSKIAIAREIAALYGFSLGYVQQLQYVAEAHPYLGERLNPKLPEKERLNFGAVVKLSLIGEHDKQHQLAKRSVRHGFGPKETQRMIERESVRTKAGILRTSRKPSRLTNSLQSFVDNASRDVDHFLDMKTALANAIAQTKDPKAMRLSLYSISDRIRELGDSF